VVLLFSSLESPLPNAKRSFFEFRQACGGGKPTRSFFRSPKVSFT
jgi:hypothetical protein